MKTLLIALGLLAAVVTPVAAKEVILSAGCYQGTCIESKFEGKELIKSVPHGQLYAATFSSRQYPFDTKPTGAFGHPSTTFVFCSTSRPAIAWMDEYAGELGRDVNYVGHQVNPGTTFPPARYIHNSYTKYYLVCHNMIGGIGLFSPEMTARAIKLGYPLNHPEQQVEISHPLELTQ